MRPIRQVFVTLMFSGVYMQAVLRGCVSPAFICTLYVKLIEGKVACIGKPCIFVPQVRHRWPLLAGF